MVPTVVWVVGEPGAGKTTLCRKVLGEVSYLVPSPKWTVALNGVVAAGHYSGGLFDGADTVPYNGVEAALTFWREVLSPSARISLLDGDRFSDARTREWLKQNLPQIKQLCLLLEPGDDACAARRVARGSRQHPVWVRGRATKSRRFWDTFPTSHRLRLLDCSEEELFAATQQWLGLTH